MTYNLESIVLYDVYFCLLNATRLTSLKSANLVVNSAMRMRLIKSAIEREITYHHMVFLKACKIYVAIRNIFQTSLPCNWTATKNR